MIILYQMIYICLFNFLTSFQGYINKIIIEELDIFIIMYIDNILIYTNEADYVNFVW